MTTGIAENVNAALEGLQLRLKTARYCQELVPVLESPQFEIKLGKLLKQVDRYTHAVGEIRTLEGQAVQIRCKELFRMLAV